MEGREGGREGGEEPQSHSQDPLLSFAVTEWGLGMRLLCV